MNLSYQATTRITLKIQKNILKNVEKIQFFILQLWILTIILKKSMMF